MLYNDLTCNFLHNLVSSDNIDNIFKPGTYVIDPQILPSGTFPPSRYFLPIYAAYIRVEYTCIDRVPLSQYIQTYMTVASGKFYVAKRRYINGAWSEWQFMYDNDSHAFITSWQVENTNTMTIAPRGGDKYGRGAYFYIINHRGGNKAGDIDEFGYLVLWRDTITKAKISGGDTITVSYANDDQYTVSFSVNKYWTLTLIYLNSRG